MSLPHLASLTKEDAAMMPTLQMCKPRPTEAKLHVRSYNLRWDQNPESLTLNSVYSIAEYLGGGVVLPWVQPEDTLRQGPEI